MDIYVGNLPYDMDEETLKQAFGSFGGVEKAKIIVDHETGRSKGFAFVTMSDWKEGQTAIKELDGSTLGGRPMKVNEARPREENRGGGGGGGRSGGGGGGGGYRDRGERGGGGGRGDREGGFREREGGFREREGSYRDREGGHREREGGYRDRDRGKGRY
jgi:cold-inducible RNA-binding protein